MDFDHGKETCLHKSKDKKGEATGRGYQENVTEEIRTNRAPAVCLGLKED